MAGAAPAGLARRPLALLGLLGLLASVAASPQEARSCGSACAQQAWESSDIRPVDQEHVWSEPDEANMLLQMGSQKMLRSANATEKPVVLFDSDSGVDVPSLLRDSVEKIRSPSLWLSVVLLLVAFFTVPVALLHGCRHCCSVREHKEMTYGHSLYRMLVALTIFGTVAAAVALLVWYFAGAILLRMIEHYDVNFLHADVHMDRLTVNPYKGLVDATDIVVGNPGIGFYKSPHLAKAGSIFVDLDMGTLIRSFGKHIVVEKLIIGNVSVIYEPSMSKGSNIQELINGLTGGGGHSGGGGGEALVDNGESGGGESKSGGGGGGGGVTMHEVKVKDVSGEVYVSMLGGVGVPVKIADITYGDFNKQVGIHTMDAIVSLILNTVLKNVLWAIG
mmetsp:Transcript_51039/g.131576  ORF Transcript_51039/g.131576 Transcript_51039/m.131576 type:complete len:390 (+) Transcript_51039:163-1332(+)